jgi:predicted nucleotidyltransferase
LEADSLSTRRKVAREAASLLYAGVEKEFKQAKLKAANTFNTSFLPANLEVALELDKIAEEREGPARKERLVRMREEALKFMKLLKVYDPLLIGSVWRGTINHDSDIDIVAYHDEPETIMNVLKQQGTRIVHAEWVSVTKKGKRKSAFHIYAESTLHEKVEIKVSSQDQADTVERCEVYGDLIRGLQLHELEKLLKENPTERFLPT